jgi:anaerobic selenocysteine-containing dehydrogenase
VGGIDYLKQKGIWFDPQEKPRYQSYKQQGFKTPSGKFEIYSNTLKSQGEHPLPVYQPLPGTARLSEKEFILIRYKSNVHTPSTANAKWSNEILHENPLWINSESADIMNIKDGDLIVVSSQAGALTCRARRSQGIHPKVVALAADVGHWGYGHIARAHKFTTNDPDTNLLWWEKDGKGINVNSLISLALDPIGKGQAWMDTKVTLSSRIKNRPQGNSA